MTIRRKVVQVMRRLQCLFCHIQLVSHEEEHSSQELIHNVIEEKASRPTFDEDDLFLL